MSEAIEKALLVVALPTARPVCDRGDLLTLHPLYTDQDPGDNAPFPRAIGE